MKNKLFIIIILIVIVIIVTITAIFLNIKENERIDREAVTFVQDLTIEYGEEAKVSDFIENLNGTLLDDHKIDTDELGNIEVSFEFINIKNKKRSRTFTIKTLDITKPKIFGGESCSTTVGKEKDLISAFLSGDDIDDNPKREIIGEYDFDIARRL